MRAKGWTGNWPEGRMVALVGDAELDEGNIDEALLECWKHGLRNAAIVPLTYFGVLAGSILTGSVTRGGTQIREWTGFS